MAQGSVFFNNKTQAIRLPKEVALPEDVKVVDIIVLGGARLIAPGNRLWDSFFSGVEASDDYMSDRGQPEIQKREFL